MARSGTPKLKCCPAPSPSAHRIDECMAHLQQALTIVDHQWYATAVHRVRALRTRLAPHRRLPEVAARPTLSRILIASRTCPTPTVFGGLSTY